ncbi:NADH-quinone oxidoreductase subunit C [Paenibacillus cymbidii]|uniref:NADH-quinone oxidoreductase subunit C n=1 Tax=Paenibacillus cymbidii TaxID=1639034 RepID=UPI001081C7F1|nr:NADH-quinone oxidoreductase subunit C [Paenibacillus cymbidii]
MSEENKENQEKQAPAAEPAKDTANESAAASGDAAVKEAGAQVGGDAPDSADVASSHSTEAQREAAARRQDEAAARGESPSAQAAVPPSASAEGSGEAAPVDPEREAKLKAAAEARAARAAAREAQQAAAGGADAPAAPAAAAAGGDDAEAKAKAAAEARAARAAARAAKTEGDAPAAPKEPSPNQPLLDRLQAIVAEEIGADAIEQAYINERDGHVPSIVVKGDMWPKCALLLRDHSELKLNYLRNLTGVDMESHIEVVYHLVSLSTKRDYVAKVKTSRDAASIPSVTPIWSTANWNEREVYDLLGVDFPGHPDLRRIMMPDDWVGYPLRKDYEPLDPEV